MFALKYTIKFRNSHNWRVLYHWTNVRHDLHLDLRNNQLSCSKDSFNMNTKNFSLRLTSTVATPPLTRYDYTGHRHYNLAYSRILLIISN